MNKCIFFALITSKRPDHGRSDLLRLILSFTSLLKFKIARDISYIHTVESTQILFVAKEMLFCGEMAILRTLCRTCGARARVRINVQMDCHTEPLFFLCVQDLCWERDPRDGGVFTSTFPCKSTEVGLNGASKSADRSASLISLNKASRSMSLTASMYDTPVW